MMDRNRNKRFHLKMVGAIGFEPTTYAAQNRSNARNIRTNTS